MAGAEVLVVMFACAIGLDLFLSWRGAAIYFRSVVPVFRIKVQQPAASTPVETWLEEADRRTCRGFVPLTFRRLSGREVAFREQFPVVGLVLPAFVAGRIVEAADGGLEILAGPRWLILLVWLAVFREEWREQPWPLLVILAMLGSLWALLRLRVRALEAALRKEPAARRAQASAPET